MMIKSGLESPKFTKPRALKPGQTIGLIAPSSALHEPEKLSVAAQHLSDAGYHVKIAESCTARHGYLAGSDDMRAEDINRFFRDDSVDAILCARGGYGATRLLHRLDYDAIRANPKVFSGFSDVTALHGALHRHASLVTFHGIMAIFGLAPPDPVSSASFFQAVSSTAPLGILRNPPGYKLEPLVEGVAQGPLIGGNLTTLASCVGTPYEDVYDGAILFLEELHEKNYVIDRLLQQLANAGVLRRIAGILLGEFTDIEDDSGDGCLSLHQIYQELLGPLGKPVLSGVRCGHCVPNLTLPLGVPCRIDADAGTITFPEGAVA